MSKIICILITVLVFASNGKSNSMNDRMEAFYLKEKVSILITDSGLGGLSVAAEIEKSFHAFHPFKEVNLIFVNALPNESVLYNSMKSTDEKIRVFNSALYGMRNQFKPDLILIACNTLSVLLDQTEFSAKETTPVIGIIEFGVNLMQQNLKKMVDNQVIIVGTPTTVSQNTHKAMLMEQGIESKRITTQGCSMLESEIQNNPASDMVSTMIEMYADEALEKMENNENDTLNLALCCTHYTYSSSLFRDIFGQISGKNVNIIDPNKEMSAYLFEQSDAKRFETTKISTRVVSQAKVLPSDINAIAGMLDRVSPAFTQALKKYELNRDLFDF